MTTYREEFPVERMAAVLGVSRSGYYAWQRRTTSTRAAQQEEFDLTVRAVFSSKKQRYGRIRLARELSANGISCSQNRVRRSMQRQGLRSKYARKFVRTTQSKHRYPASDNLLERNFTAPAPNKIWVTDITYLPCRAGWLYLVVFIDLYSRMIVGWYVSHSLRHQAVVTAFDQAVYRRRPECGLIVHSDRGIQYCCPGFRAHMEAHHVVQSMSRKGDCWDNAVAESFFATLKKELRITFITQKQAEQILFEYIEIEYNRQRLHSTLDYRSPAAFETETINELA